MMFTMSAGFLRWDLRDRLGDRGHRVEQPHLHGLVALAALDQPELHACAGLQGGRTRGQGVGADVDVAPVVLGQEAEALVGVVPLDLASRHG